MSLVQIQKFIHCTARKACKWTNLDNKLAHYVGPLYVCHVLQHQLIDMHSLAAHANVKHIPHMHSFGYVCHQASGKKLTLSFNASHTSQCSDNWSQYLRMGTDAKLLWCKSCWHKIILTV